MRVKETSNRNEENESGRNEKQKGEKECDSKRHNETG